MKLVRRHVVLAVALCLTAAAAGDQEAVRSLWQQGASLYQSGDLQGAIDRWQEALALDPTNGPIAEKIARTETELASRDGNPQQDEVAWPLNPNSYTPLRTSPSAYLAGGRTMIPVRALLEWMGATVDFARGTITASMSNGRAVRLTVGSRQARVADRAVLLDVAPVVRNGTTFVPLRFVSEGLGADVRWDAAESTVYVHRDNRFASTFVTDPSVVAALPPAYRPGSNLPPTSWTPRRPVSTGGGLDTNYNNDYSASGSTGGGSPTSSGGGLSGTGGSTTSAGGACPQGGAHTPGKRDRDGRLHCARCGRFM